MTDDFHTKTDGFHQTTGEGSNANVVDYIFTSVVLYLVCSIVRIIMIAGGFPVLHYLGYGLTMKEATMLSLSGLRGAISLALALLIERSPLVGQSLCPEGVLECPASKEIRDIMLIQVAGVVSLSLLVNGSLAGVVYKCLHVYKSNPSMTVIQELAIAKLKAEYLLRGICTHNESHNFHLILGLNCA